MFVSDNTVQLCIPKKSGSLTHPVALLDEHVALLTHHVHCRFEVADATDLKQFADNSFDGVCCASGLFLFPDQPRCALLSAANQATQLLFAVYLPVLNICKLHLVQTYEKLRLQ